MFDNKIKNDLCNERAGIGILAFIPNPIISVNEAWFLSNTEKVHMLFCKINEIINKVNSYEDLFAQIQGVLNDFDDTVKTEVEKYIKQMYENGELKNILEEVCAKYFNEFSVPKTSIIDFARMYRVLKLTANYMFTQPAISTAADDTRTEHFAFCQGSCAFKINGTIYHAMIFIPNDGSPYQEGGDRYTGNGLIEIRKLNGDLVKSIVVPAIIGHGQTIAYHKGYLYWSGSRPDDSDYVRKVHRISYNFEQDSTCTTYLLPYSLNGLCSYDDKLYMTSAKATEIDVYTVDMEDDGVTPTGTVSNHLIMSPARLSFPDGSVRNTIFSAGFAVTEKYYYFGTHNPAGIIRCKRNFDGDIEKQFTVEWYYNIPFMLNDNEFLTGEPEGVTVFDDGDCYLFTSQHLNTKAVAMHDITQVFKQNLFRNDVLPYISDNPTTGRGNIYISGNSVNNEYATYNQQWHNNPTGKSWDTAFNTIDEAVWWFNHTPKYGYGRFFMRGNNPFVVWCVYGKTYYFDGRYNRSDNGKISYQEYYWTDNDGTVNPISMLGNIIVYGGTVKLEQIRAYSTIHYLSSGVANSSTADALSSYHLQKQNPIFVDQGNVIILNTGGQVSSTTNPNVKGCIYMRDSVGVYNSTAPTDGNVYSYKTNLDNTYGEYRWLNNDVTNRFMSLGTCYLNCHSNVHQDLDNGLSHNNAVNMITS